jgi:hypothetical protein
VSECGREIQTLVSLMLLGKMQTITQHILEFAVLLV